MDFERHYFRARDLEVPAVLPLCGGTVAVFTRRCPGKDEVNEDAALLLSLGAERGLLAVADGMGGLHAGEKASEAALKSLDRRVRADLAEGRTLREAILSGFEAANAAVGSLKLGAGTTLSVLQIEGRDVRSYHVGDSEALIVGQRGRRKLETIAHSPVGYGVEAGLIDEEDALRHEERHVISNALGGAEMRVDMSHRVRLADRDTMLLASDGLFDNLETAEIVERVRKGPLPAVAAGLQATALERMQAPKDGAPSKPDDLTFVIYRPAPGGRAAVAHLPPALRRVIRRYALRPHPEGGWYRETHRSRVALPLEGLPGGYPGDRAAVTSILYLLPAGRPSRRHRVRSEELWLHHAGDAVDLSMVADEPGAELRRTRLGPGPGEWLQASVPPGWWQHAEVVRGKHGYALLGCVVAPGFEFEDLEVRDESP